jgi:hypothetical protein
MGILDAAQLDAMRSLGYVQMKLPTFLLAMV